MNKLIDSVLMRIEQLRKDIEKSMEGASTGDILTNISDSFRELSALEAQLDFLIASSVEE